MRLAPLAVLSAALIGSACLKTDITVVNGGLPPDTLPLAVADSVITFSMETSALFAGDSIQVFFTIRNNGSTNRAIQGSSSCALTVRAYTLSGTLVSPPANRACTADVVTYATLTPGESITLPRRWSANSTGTAGGGGTALSAGVYELEPFVDAVNFQRTGRRLKVQVAKP